MKTAWPFACEYLGCNPSLPEAEQSDLPWHKKGCKLLRNKVADRDAEWQARVEAAEAAERLAVMTLAGGPSEATLAKARAEGNAEGIKLGRRMGLAIAGWSNDEIEALIAKTEAGT